MALKIDIINVTYAHIAISGITVGAAPEDNALALDVLEDMAAELDARNICTGYNLQDAPDLNDESNLPRRYLNAFKTNLAVRLLSAFGKQIPQSLSAQANQSMSSMSARTATVRPVQQPSRMARGSGNTLRYNRWSRFYRSVPETPISCATNKMIIGEINDFTEHFDAYLNDGEDIASFTLTADTGLDVISSSNTFTDVLYRIEAIEPGRIDDNFMQVSITVTTTDGRVNQRTVNFDVRKPPEID